MLRFWRAALRNPDFEDFFVLGFQATLTIVELGKNPLGVWSNRRSGSSVFCIQRFMESSSHLAHRVRHICVSGFPKTFIRDVLNNAA